jgi:cytochrome c5
VSQQETIPVKNLAFGLAIAFGALAIFIFIVLMFSRLGLDEHHGEAHSQSHEVSQQERIKPVGQVRIEGQPEPTPVAAEKTPTPAVETASAPKSGKEIFDSVCFVCHKDGILGSPKLGDKAEWTKRLEKGEATLVQNSINGIFQMPPRGGNKDLSDEDLKKAVQYILAEAGLSQETDTPKTEEIAPVTSEETTTEATAASPDIAKGEQIYKTSCFACHDQAVAGAPKLGDKESWAPRIEQDLDTLFNHALQGFQGKTGVMPPKGGYINLPDEDVKAAVIYMLDAVGAANTTSSQTEVIETTTTTAEESASTEEKTTESTTTEAAQTEEKTMESTTVSSDLDLVKGEEIYNSACALCHGAGTAKLVKAPEFGNKEDWAPRIAQGMETLFSHALNGFQGAGMMPPKGGFAHLADEDVKAAVAYMVSNAQ